MIVAPIRNLITAALTPKQDGLQSTVAASAANRQAAPLAPSASQALPTAGNLPTTTLPDGRRIAYVTERDVQFIYQEIYEEHQYEGSQLRFPQGGTVVDVGANIGLFSLYAAQRVGATGRVVCMEPVPKTYAALVHNVHMHDAHGNISTVNMGASDGSQQEATFRVYSTAAGWSTMHPDDGELLKNLQVMLGHALPEGHGMPKGPLALLGRWLMLHVPLGYKLVEWVVLQLMVRLAVDVTCQLTTLSTVVEQHDLSRIDLLKVDVEGAELDVLRGLRDEHWSLVQQVALEVHDRGEQLDHIRQLLQQKGFQVKVGQDRFLANSKLYAVLAFRQ